MGTFDLTAFSEILDTGGPTLIIMLITSVILVALALARFWVVGSAWLGVKQVERKLMSHIRKSQWEEARKVAAGLGFPLRDIFVAGLDRVLGQVKGDPAMAMAREQKRTMGVMKTSLWILGSTGALMPFVGLFGTVVGVMSSFEAIKDVGTGGVQVVSGGIAEALVATAAGLFVALEAIIFFNILQNMISSIGRDLGLLIDEILEAALVREKAAEVPVKLNKESQLLNLPATGGPNAERAG
jgi:biopolymer transport protein ExbB